MKKQKKFDTNNIEEESGGPNFIYDDDILQHNIENKKKKNIY